jgi:hypothetical protein
MSSTQLTDVVLTSKTTKLIDVLFAVPIHISSTSYRCRTFVVLFPVVIGVDMQQSIFSKRFCGSLRMSIGMPQSDHNLGVKTPYARMPSTNNLSFVKRC